MVRRILVLGFLATGACGQPPIAPDLTAFVDPFIGTESAQPNDIRAGNMFPGATFPLGMVQFSPDNNVNVPGGYFHRDNTIHGFSLTHFSGRGCVAYGDVPLMPFVGTVPTSPATNPAPHYASSFDHASEVAEPGYYRVWLDGPSTNVELSATARSAVGRFTFPSTPMAGVIINAGGSARGTTQSSVQIDAEHRIVSGSASAPIGCGTDEYVIYFVAEFDQPFVAFGTWDDVGAADGNTAATGKQAGAWVNFDATINPVVAVKVGISYVSQANAQLNAETEAPITDFDAVRSRARAAWSERLGRIRTEGGSDADNKVFYTALYHSFFHPNLFSDVNGEYLGFDGNVHTTTPDHAQYHNTTSWDAWRSLIALRAILEPNETSDILQSLVVDAQQGDGHLPRWEQTRFDSHGMVGDGADILIATGHAFGARGFDAQAALDAADQGQPSIREGLVDYVTIGYVPIESHSDSSAVTLEYANDDFALSQLAAALGDGGRQSLFRSRADQWRNVFNAQTGYVQARQRDGAWVTGWSPTQGNGQGFTEGTSAQYSWMVNFDLPALIDAIGGSSAATARLDAFFRDVNSNIDRDTCFIGNEPSVETPWIYDFAGAPAKTQEVVRRIQNEVFTTEPNGLPGNDDGGALSSWYVFSAIGLYPIVPGVAGFVVGSPRFSGIEILPRGGSTIKIHASGAATGAPYVQSLAIDGRSHDSLWIPWDALSNGAVLDFVLGSTAGAWGSASTSAPPLF